MIPCLISSSPSSSHTFPLIESFRSDYGMPSGHSMFVSFAWTVHLLPWHHLRTKDKSGQHASSMRILLSSALAGMVLSSRILLGHHTIGQVMVGVIAGGLFAVACHFVYLWVQPFLLSVYIWFYRTVLIDGFA